MQPNCIILYP